MDAIKAEKEMAIRRFRRLRQVGLPLRCIEAAAVLLLLLLSYSSDYIPSAAKHSGNFLRRAAAFLVSPRFVFLLGNAIVLVLLKSGHFSTESAAADAIIGGAVGSGELSYPQPPHLGLVGEEAGEEEKTVLKIRACRRSRSDKFERRHVEGKLRRSETEIGRKAGKICPPEAHDREVVAAQDREEAGKEDDAEQFRRTIEEFIAKQQRFQREESLAVVAG